METLRARDLRIGNWLKGQHFVQITKILSEDKVGIGSGDPYIVSGNEPCLTPIPLTEEWLLKFGFKQWGTMKHLWKKKGTQHFTITSNWHDDAFTLNEIENKRIFKILYVHQLQNLYFALTGNELELK